MACIRTFFALGLAAAVTVGATAPASHAPAVREAQSTHEEQHKEHRLKRLGIPTDVSLQVGSDNGHLRKQLPLAAAEQVSSHRQDSLAVVESHHVAHQGAQASVSTENHRHPPDGYADTDSNHPRKTPPQDDPEGDSLNWGPDAAWREVSVTGKMPDHFSVVTLFLGECHPDQCAAWDRGCTWGLMLSGIVMCWTFKNLKVISDLYFVPATIGLSRRLGLRADVAGATLLAFGSSAPEFCTNVVATFFIVNECGVGDIIGSAIHNILLVVGISGIFACRVLNLWWYPLCRDCLFYALSIVELTVFLWDEHITIPEASFMCLTYVVYCAWMLWNQPLYTNICKVLKVEATVPDEGEEEEEESEGSIIYYDPLEMIWRNTMPSPDEASWICFFAALFNVAWLSYLMVDAATRFGCIMGIPTLFMGLVFLAAGTSIPDAFASMGAAKRGEGDMAVSNALGSNIFDILLGLGLPWLIALCLGKPIVFLGVNRLLYWVAILMVVLVLFIVVVAVNGWKLGFRLGVMLGVMYAFYVGFALTRSMTETQPGH